MLLRNSASSLLALAENVSTERCSEKTVDATSTLTARALEQSPSTLLALTQGVRSSNHRRRYWHLHRAFTLANAVDATSTLTTRSFGQSPSTLLAIAQTLARAMAVDASAGKEFRFGNRQFPSTL